MTNKHEPVSLEGLPFGELLKTLRKRRNISQQELARRVGKHLNTIGGWERGDFLPETQQTVLELARVLQIEMEETRYLLEASLTALAPSKYIPQERNPFFTGRQAQLDLLHEHLRQPSAGLARFALQGLGGIGKTQLALEYAYRYAAEYRAIFWLSSETFDTLTASLVAIAEALRLPKAEESDQRELVQAMKLWLVTHKGWLLIVDNLEEIALIRQVLPPAPQGAVLLTTRLQTLEGLAPIYPLPPLSEKEGILFLLKRARLNERAGLQASEVSPDLMAQASALVSAMGGLPLALDQAGAYLEQTGCRPGDYLELLQQQERSMLADRPAHAAHPASVAETFRLSMERTSQTSPAAADFLAVCAFVAPEAIPEEFFLQASAYLGTALQAATADALSFQALIGSVLRYSLLSRQANQRTFALHRLVQAVLRDLLTEDEQAAWLTKIIDALEHIFPAARPETRAACERLLTHVLACIQHATRQHISTPVLATLIVKAGRYLATRSHFAQAESLLKQALHIQEQLTGPEDAIVASIINSLAGTCGEQGKYEEAADLYKRALGLQEQIHGPLHPAVARPLSNLAHAWNYAGRYQEAEPLYHRAIQILEQALGADHADVAWPVSGLGDLYSRQQNYEQARACFQRALEIRERALGPDHELVSWPLTNLAEIYTYLGRYAEAESLFLRGLHIQEQTLSPTNMQRILPLVQLAMLYITQNRLDEAEAILQQGLTIWQKGPQHIPHIHVTLLDGQEKLKQARRRQSGHVERDA